MTDEEPLLEGSASRDCARRKPRRRGEGGPLKTRAQGGRTLSRLIRITRTRHQTKTEEFTERGGAADCISNLPPFVRNPSE